MATCPRCRGFLDTDHRCRGLWRMRLRALFVVSAAGAAGGAGSWLFALLMYDHANSAFVALIALAAAVVQHVLMMGEPQ